MGFVPAVPALLSVAALVAGLVPVAAYVVTAQHDVLAYLANVPTVGTAAELARGFLRGCRLWYHGLAPFWELAIQRTCCPGFTLGGSFLWYYKASYDICQGVLLNVFGSCGIIVLSIRREVGIMNENRLLTVPEVAEKLRIHPDTVRQWLRSGKLKGKRLGGTKSGWRIPEQEIERFLKAS